MHDPWLTLGLFLLAVFGTAIVGGCVGSWLTLRHLNQTNVEPADAFDAVEEETVEVPVIAPVLTQWFTDQPADPVAEYFGDFEPEPEPEPEPDRVVALRPMSAMERLEGPTRLIVRTADGYQVRPWWYGGRHREPESRCRVPRFLSAPQATAEFPEIQVGHHRSGEYPMVEVSG